MTTRITEVRGLRATWRHGRGGIEILDVHDIVSNTEDSFPPGTDLAAARELRPDLADLWDVVRREFWDHYLAARVVRDEPERSR
ncbi:hypothetical protein C8258_24255 [Nocardia sp. MDA0666]|uniref:hypothetical protein n=1 Tax=Nocardia sp. MDA0666 TaxID=2135448 RepID=UPI000D121DBF|nr:hypothetical protein [Nocardia sp. MDA0666]PSR63149.1 hypothetical protein C8258_24255 [Nocardia sp. MDA0666]